MGLEVSILSIWYPMFRNLTNSHRLLDWSSSQTFNDDVATAKPTTYVDYLIQLVRVKGISEKRKLAHLWNAFQGLQVVAPFNPTSIRFKKISHNVTKKKIKKKVRILEWRKRRRIICVATIRTSWTYSNPGGDLLYVQRYVEVRRVVGSGSTSKCLLKKSFC